MDKDKFHQLLDIKYSNLRTREAYRGFAKRIEKFWEGDQFTQQSLNLFMAELVAGCRQGRLGSLPMAFVKLYTDCFAEDVIDAGQHPLKIIRPASRQIVRLEGYKFLNREALNTLLHSIDGKKQPYLKITARLMAESGLRISELLSVKGTDIDLVHCTIRGIGKGNKEYKVRFSTYLRDMLKEWFGTAPISDRPFIVFHRYSPLPIKDSAQRVVYWDRLSAHLKKKGLPHISPHQLRHTFARLCRDKAGMDIQEIKTAMRHIDISSTIRYAPATNEEVAKKVEGVWGKKDDN
jgi:integrase